MFGTVKKRRSRRRSSIVTAGVAVMACVGAVAAPVAQAATGSFTTGFESGTMSGWQHVTNSGLGTVRHSGHWGWDARNNGNQASYAYYMLPRSYRRVQMTAWVKVTSHSASVKLFAIRPAGGNSVEVYVDSHNRISLRNNIGKVTTHSGTTLTNGRWHVITLGVNGGIRSGSLSVRVDGRGVPGLRLAGQNLGAKRFGQIRLGDLGPSKTYRGPLKTFNIAIDDVTVRTGSARRR